MKVVKDVRAMALIAVTLLSILILALPYLGTKSGVIVTSMDAGSKCSNVYIGSIISQMTGGSIKTADDFQNIVKNTKSGDYVTMVVDGGPGGCMALSNGYLGIAVSSIKSNYLRLAPEIQGSIKNYYSLTENYVQNDVTGAESIIQGRISSLNLQYTKAKMENGNITVTSSVNENTDNLISQCYLTGIITATLNLQNGRGELKSGNNTYEIFFSNGKVGVDNYTFGQNQNVIIGGMNVQFSNVTNSSAVESIYFVNNSDIASVIGYGGVNYDSASRQFYFSIPVSPSANSVNILKGVAKNLGSSLSGGQLVLNGNIEYYLDGVLLSSLPIPYTVTTQPVTSLSIVGIGPNQKFVSDLNTKTLMCLNSQPLNFKIVKTSSVSIEPIYRNDFYTILTASVVLALVVPFLSFAKSKSLRDLSLLLVITQVPITFGVAMLTQIIFPSGATWVFDILATVGLLASMFISQISIRFGQKIVQMKTIRWLDWIVFLISFATMLSPFKGIGLSLFVGLVLKVLFYQALVKTA